MFVILGYSGADMRNLCGEAAMGPIRDIVNGSMYDIETVPIENVILVSVCLNKKYGLDPSYLNC